MKDNWKLAHDPLAPEDKREKAIASSKVVKRKF
jgi:hypothetical protein